MRSASDKQAEILEYITSCIENEGYPPSVREICAAVGLRSPSTVHAHLKALERAGLIKNEPGKKRALSLPGSEERRSVSVPLVGTVAAGQPILAVESIEVYIPLGQDQARGRELFALRIHGESMIEAGIMDGDIVVVEKTPYARNGDLVIALIGDEATCKTFYKENGHFRLQPENSTMDPIIVDEVVILGRVVVCTRYYD